MITLGTGDRKRPGLASACPEAGNAAWRAGSGRWRTLEGSSSGCRVSRGRVERALRGAGHGERSTAALHQVQPKKHERSIGREEERKHSARSPSVCVYKRLLCLQTPSALTMQALWSTLGSPQLILHYIWLLCTGLSSLLQRTVARGKTVPVSATGRIPDTVPTSVNYHFTRKCNYKCGFCFHTAKTSFVLPLEEAKRGLRLLTESGMEKINFSGGEPFLEGRGEFLGQLVQFCKQELRLPSVSVVSNGSMIREKWFQKYGDYLDILAISCDSFDEDTNQLIGRTQGRKSHVENLYKIRGWCQQYRVAFKINSVINTFNMDEDMTQQITQLSPVRWKVFQCLLIDGENAGENALREAERFVISDQDFQSFLQRHSSVSCLVPESNEKMRNSYLILDEYMRFLDCRGGGKEPSRSILDVGVNQAILFSGFDEKMFLKRGGKYVWSKADMKMEW